MSATLATAATGVLMAAPASAAVIAAPAATAAAPIPEFAYAQFARSSGQPDTSNGGTLRVVTNAGGALSDTTLAVGVPVTAQVAMNATGQIAFTAKLSDGSLQVYTVNSDGSNLNAVTPPGYQFPVWSPDGSKLAVTAYAPPNAAKNVVSVVDVRDADKLTSLPLDQPPGGVQFVEGPAVWAPDGSKVAFTAAEFGEGSGGTAFIHVANPDGSGSSTLTSYGFGAWPGRLAWSPDGQWIAFAGGIFPGGGAERFGVQLAPAGGAGAVRTIADGAYYEDIDGFSPDGTSLLVQRGGPSLQSPALVSVKTDGSDVTVYAAPSAVTAAWAPDGKHALYCQKTVQDGGSAREYPADIYLLDTATGATDRLTTSGQACDPAVAPRTVRYAGATRIETSISLSRQKPSAPAVVIARSDLYPDALAAAPLVAKVGGSLLLSPFGGLTPALKAEVTRLGASVAYVIGDETALSAQVDADLRADGVATVTRIGGATRYDTAALIAQRVGGARAFVARGDDWPDAASVSQLAALRAEPILLTPKDSLDPAVTSALAAMHTTEVTIVGGPAAVTSSVEMAIKETGVSTSRLAGADRWATSAAVASAVPPSAFDDGATLVDGLNWPDAIAAGPSVRQPMVLVDPVSLSRSPATEAWLAAKATSLVVAVGGPDVVSPADVAAALTRPLP